MLRELKTIKAAFEILYVLLRKDKDLQKFAINFFFRFFQLLVALVKNY